LAAGDVGRVQHVYVSRDHRGQGIGRTLMSRAIEICARALFKHIFISCRADNAPAMALYRRFGFDRIGEFVAYQARP
jgi:ribosomal protein S18 acetylase RimI-like enzyme